MDQGKVKDYLEELAQNKELQGKLEQAKSPEEALTIMQEAGFDFDFESFKSLKRRLLAEAKNTQDNELTDEETAMVAGGSGGSGDSYKRAKEMIALIEEVIRQNSTTHEIISSDI